MQTLGLVFTPLNCFSADKKNTYLIFFILFNIFQIHQNRRRTPREVPLSEENAEGGAWECVLGTGRWRGDLAFGRKYEFF